MAVGLAAAAGGGVVLGGLSAYAAAKAKKAEVEYQKKVKVVQDKLAVKDLRKANHDAVMANFDLREQTIRNKDQMANAVARDVANAVVQQATLGISGNTASRVTNALYGAQEDAETMLDLSARAEFDNIKEQLNSFKTQTQRQLGGGKVVDFSTGMGTFLSIGNGALSGASSGLAIYQGAQNLTP